MALTKNKPEWETKLAELDNNPFGYVHLKCDGYTVSFQNRIYNRRMVTTWFVDGTWKGEYSQKENPIGQKFGRPYTLKKSPTTINIIRLLNGPKAAKDAKKEKALIGFRNYWDSSRSLITHLKKTCTQIEIFD